MCPFRSEVTLCSSYLFGLINTKSESWLVVHRARPRDNPAVDRWASRIFVFSSRSSAIHDVELADARITDVAPAGPAGTEFTLFTSGRQVRLSLPTVRFQWLCIVLSDDFAAGRGAAFDAAGNVNAPSWMVARNAFFRDEAAIAAAAAAVAATSRPAATPLGPVAGTFVMPPSTGYPFVPSASPGGSSIGTLPIHGGVPHAPRYPFHVSDAGHMATVVAPPAEPVGRDGASVTAAAAAVWATDPAADAAGFGIAPASTFERAASEQHGGAHGSSGAGSAVAVEEEQDEDDEDAPPEFFCPITLELMRDPVFATDGHSYERSAITEWLQSQSRSPKTGEALDNPMLIPNHVLRGQLIAWREQRKADRLAELAAAPSLAEGASSAEPAAPTLPPAAEEFDRHLAVAVAPPPL